MANYVNYGFLSWRGGLHRPQWYLWPSTAPQCSRQRPSRGRGRGRAHDTETPLESHR